MGAEEVPPQGAAVEVAPAAAPEASAPTRKSAQEENKLDAAKRAAAPTKEDRLKAEVAEMAAQPKVDPDASYTTGGTFKTRSSKNKRGAIIKDGEERKSSSSGPSTGATMVTNDGVKTKVIVSPADAFDEDELPLSRSNWPALFAVIFTPTLVYLGFWVLGSLEVI